MESYQLRQMRPLQGTTEQKLEQIRREYNATIEDLRRIILQQEKAIEKIRKELNRNG